MHQDAFDLVSEGVLWVDVAGRIQYGNESAAQLLGYNRNQLQRASYFEINPHFSMLGWKRFWNRLQENTQERLDTEFVNRDGKLFSIRGRAGFDIYSIDPELCLIIFQATELGKRDADLLEAVQRDGNIGAWEVNLTTNQVFIAPLIRKWLGLVPDRSAYPASALLSLLHERLVPDDYAGVRTAYKELRKSSSRRSMDLHLRAVPAQEGTTPVLYTARAQSVENELEVYKVYGTLVKAAAAAAPPGESDGKDGNTDLFRAVLDRQNDAVYVISYADRTITYANDRALEATGYTRRDLIGMPAARLGTTGDAEMIAGLYDQLRERKYLEVKTHRVRKDTTTRLTMARLYYHQSERGEFVILIAEDAHEDPEVENLQLYVKTLDALQEWVIWLNADNEIALLNEAARRKLKRKTSRPLEGLPLLELMPDLEVPSLTDVRQEQIDGRFRSAVDYIYTNPSGEDRTLQVRFAQVAAGAQFLLCLICRDVTIQYNNKRRLQKTKRRVDELTKQLQIENETLREQVEQINTSGPIITVSRKYQQVLAQIAQVADTDATVLVTGETGTGKELLAQSIHKFSRRSDKPLVSVNCAALPESLIESELFGHERGAFTGAIGQKKGRFEQADGGTIFLDEIGELPLDMQAKLLRVLQEGEIQRIGSTDAIYIDVRIVAATNRDLEQMIADGTFREDLFYRLNVFPIHNMPLRERKEDIPVLTKHFAKLYSDRMGRNIKDINPRDLELLTNYEFPGNVRELINLVERAVITSTTSTLNLRASLTALRRNDRSEEGSFRSEKIISFDAMQKQYIIEALKRTGGKVTGPGGAAELLDLNGRTLMSKMNKFGIDRNKFTG